MVQLEGSIPLHLFKLEKPVEGIAKPFGEETKKKVLLKPGKRHSKISLKYRT